MMRESQMTAAADEKMNIQDHINEIGDKQGAHILYMFDDEERYMDHAVDYIAEGILKKQKIIVVESKSFLGKLKDKLLEKGLPLQKLKKITYVENDELYSSASDFNASNSYENLLNLLEPNFAGNDATRIWGQVLVQGNAISELRKYECACDDLLGEKHVISVCSYNALTCSSFIQNEMLKVHEYFMTDEQIVKSPLYSEDYLLEFAEADKKKLKKIEQDYEKIKEKNNKLLLEHHQLQMAKRNAEKANRTKSIFLSQMSHDLRTPLNSISGFTQILLEEEQMSGKSLSMLNRINDSSNHLLELIKEILDFSAIEAGNIRLNVKPIPVKTLLEECISAISFEEHSNVDIVVEPMDEDLYIEADHMRIKQVINNLLTNALKYNTDNGKIRIYTSRGQNRLKLNVEDTGIGIPEQEIDMLFKAFYRSKRNMQQWKGSGLGLAIVSKLTKEMDGLYGAYNNEGKGATFWVSFKSMEKEQVVLFEGENRMKEVIEPVPSQEKKVLYIEDQPENLELIEAVLKSVEGASLSAAETGREGIQAAAEHSPDLILLDLGLPDIDGREVLSSLKEEEATRDIPVIVISADANDSTVEDMSRRGCVEYITKPVQLQELKKKLSVSLQVR
ncbi:ATP-binding protein [Alkalicoccus halolimnae]|uniref:histidine kinase n=1 Tax=Alkalicoccus halolimnae TaxID=1667239 RepID=A0A5C7F7X2_9BACI|nr:ATP-binding protein [Alkalicoccus halolimnae]TXF86143.1 response regulator [Alkalicoccus halolimnae]